MFTTILVPLDGSEIAEAALGYAALLPSERVSLLRVEPDERQGGVREEAAWQAEAEAASVAYLDQRAEELRRQGREVVPLVVRGDPAEQIVAHAGDAGLIVMTTQGCGAGKRALFGSVADRVVRHAAAPTLVVRTKGRPAGPPRVARVVVPIDGSELSLNALPIAARLAALLGVPVRLVRVVDSDPAHAGRQAGPPAATHREAAADLDAHARTLLSRNIAASTEVLEGNPASELLDAIVPTDLVVMSTRGRGGIGRWPLGSVADKLVHEASAPVLLVRPGVVAAS